MCNCFRISEINCSEVEGASSSNFRDKWFQCLLILQTIANRAVLCKVLLLLKALINCSKPCSEVEWLVLRQLWNILPQFRLKILLRTFWCTAVHLIKEFALSLALKWRLGSTGKWHTVAPTNQNTQRQSNEPIINILNMTGVKRGRSGGSKAPLVLTSFLIGWEIALGV